VPPAPPRFVSYLRVSTETQGRSGLGLDAQRQAVATQIVRADGELVAEFREVESGKRADRPQLAAALAACRTRRTVLVIATLDRLARNARFLLSIVEGSGEAGRQVHDHADGGGRRAGGRIDQPAHTGSRGAPGAHSSALSGGCAPEN
jgi:DNA invertase Pin-like site-specific DNA recombinase